eukprot:XP_011671923.1 PREDICTED: caldesmon isoform X4 [Strongylocentrotus purpuratus]
MSIFFSSNFISLQIGSNPEHIVNMLKYRISPAIYLPHIERGGTLLELLDILGKDSNSEESVAESERDEEELVPVKIEQEEEKESESGDSNDNDVDNVLVPVKIEYEEDELQEEEEKEPENGDSDDSDDNDIDNVLVPVKIEHDKDTEKLHPVETIETNKSVNEGVNEEWDPTNDIDFYVQLFTSEGGLKEADVTQSGIQISASSIREKGKLCVEYRNKKGEVNEKEQEEENNDEEEEEEEENDNEGEEEVEEEGEELQEEDDNDVHNLVLVPVNIEHEQNEKHKSKDEKLHPVDTVEKRKFLDERETEELDPKNDIDASVELFTSDGGSKEADVKQSGRQKAASSVRNKGKRFRITRVCEICSASTDDMSKHLERTHKLSKEERQKYLLAARGRIPIRRRAMIENPSTGRKQSKRADCPLCQGKNYTSLQNHFETKHGLEANEAKEIRKRMKQGKRFRITRHCEICSASTDDMSKHLERTHKLSKEERQKYILAARGRVPIRRRAMIENPSSGRKQSKRENCPLCEGKHYTSLQNHLETKHGLEANEAKEIRKRMKQEKQLRTTSRCEICSASTDDMSKHLARTHKLSKEERQKHYTSLLNPLKSKQGDETNEAKEIRNHKSKDEKLHPVETVETSKSLDERETEELDPKNDIDAPVELFTSDGGSKEADVKQSGRQKSASSIRKKGKRFRITRHCEICSASTDDMSKHLERTHKLSKEERQKYILAARGRIPIRRRAMIENPSTGRKQSKREDCPLCEGKHYTSLQNHLKSKHGLEANEAKEIHKRMKQGFVKQGPGVELDEAHQLGTDAADFETNDLLSRYRSFINLASDTTYGESSSTQHCRQLKKMCEMAFSKLLKGGLTPRINDDVVPSGECSKQKEREASNSQMDAVKDVPGEGACSSVEERPTKRKRKLLDSEEEDILRTEVQQAVNKPRRKGLRFREIVSCLFGEFVKVLSH